MTNGIYLYFDTKKNSVVYVGRDSYIDKKARHKAHMSRSSQKFDSILQNNPDRYEYRVYCEGNFSNEELNNLEIQTIKFFDTLHRKDAYNYTEGGEGIVGFKHSNETRKKISESKSGEKNPMYGKKGENHPRYGTKHSEETRKKMSEANSGENSPMYGRTGENNPNWKNYATVIKYGITPNGKQNYALRYNGEDHTYNINKKELEEVADEINKLENKDDEIIKQILEEYKARKKNYATVVKAGFTNGKQRYALIQNGETISKSIYKEKLEKKAEERNKNKK